MAYTADLTSIAFQALSNPYSLLFVCEFLLFAKFVQLTLVALDLSIQLLSAATFLVRMTRYDHVFETLLEHPSHFLRCLLSANLSIDSSDHDCMLGHESFDELVFGSELCVAHLLAKGVQKVIGKRRVRHYDQQSNEDGLTIVDSCSKSQCIKPRKVPRSISTLT